VAISALVRAAAETATLAAAPLPQSTRDVPSQAAYKPTQPLPAVSAAPKGGDASAEPLVIPSAEELEAALKTLSAPARDIVAALLGDGALESPTASKAAPTTEPHASSTDRSPAQTPESLPQRDTAPKTIAIRILAQSQPSADPMPLRPQVATRSDAITLVGTAVADGATGTEIATPIGRLRLPLPAAALAQGTRITFEVLARADSQLASQPEGATESLARFVEAERDWSAVHDLAARWPEAADALLPKAGQPLGPALLAFIAAVRGGGNLKAWLGSRFAEAADAPDKKEMIARLGHDMATQARGVAATERDGWQTIAVPVVDAGRVSELRFRFKKRDRRDGNPDDGGRRFMVQSTLSALGPLQIDGTVRERHLDLVVRTAKALPAPMRRDIADVFARSLADTDYRGEIRFLNDAFADPMPATAGHGSGVVV
jgi:hypothetical protein